MRPVSPDFLAECSRSHQVAVEAWLYPADGSDPVAVPVTDGSVTLEATAAVRGRCDVRTEHAEWIPLDASDGLSPFGHELELRRGVVLPNGSTETVPLGRFGIEDAEVTDDGTGPSVRVSALDRAERMSKAKFTDIYQVPAGKEFTTAILEMLREAWPAVPVMDGFEDMSDISVGQPVTAQEGEDRWEAAQILAQALGMILFFDGDGVLTLKPYAAGGPVLDLVEGEGGVLLNVARNWSRSASFNKVVVTGESSGDNVFRGEAFDDNPLSPTYFYGPFGQVPEFRSYPEVRSDQQAKDVAYSILAQHLGAPATVSFGMVPNPALEPEDTIRISRPSVGVDHSYIVDSLTIGLAATESMTGQTRERISF